MKIGCSSWSYHRTIEEGKLNQESWIEKCAELKLDGVELLDVHFPSTGIEYLKRLKKKLVELGLTISCVSASNHFTGSDEDERKANVEIVKKWVDIAGFLGAPIVRIFAGSSSELSQPDIWHKVVNCLKECANYAEAKGIVLGLENHGGFSADEVLRLIQETDSEWLKMTLDTGNFPQAPYESIRKTAHLAVIVHAKLYELDEEGNEERLDYEKIISILSERNYLGFLSIEFEGESDELSFIPRGVAYLKKVMNMTGS
ncbi:sugar phosphate isomerase/epimerase [candidate division WOR-3 bacterium]|nr:sugar phosphate isomerase/epimerase [candidate division WOR-3 bacterium]